MERLNIGEPIEVMRGHEGVYFNCDGSGYILTFNFSGPTSEEIEQIAVTKPFEIRATTYDDHLIITAKAGNLNWVDAPFAPQLAQVADLKKPQREAEGTALTVVMTDANDGCVKKIRLIGLGHDFSVKLLDEILRINEMPFVKNDYDREIVNIFAKFDTYEIAKHYFCRYKIHG